MQSIRLSPTAALALAVLTAGVAAQPPIPKGGLPKGGLSKSGGMYAPFDVAFTDSFGLLLLPEVCQEIKADNGQIARLDQALAALQKEYNDAATKAGDLSRDEGSSLVANVRKKVEREGEAALARIFRPEQVKRYRQIAFQYRGQQVLTDPAVLAALKLTDEQRAAFQRVGAEQQEKLNRLMRRTTGVRSEEADQVAAEEIERSVALLTPEQKKMWDELRGASFPIEPGGYFRKRKLP